MISLEELRTTALMLSDDERAGLAHALLLSLRNDGERPEVVTTVAYPKEYEREIERRVQGYEQEQMGAVSKDVFINRMQQRTQ